MLNICWQSYHLCLKILAVVSRFWNSYINFIFYLIQSWTKIVGTLVHNSVVFRYSISILPSPPFNVVLLWTRRANFIAHHVWLQHWFRGVGSVKCPSINGQDCRYWTRTTETPEMFQYSPILGPFRSSIGTLRDAPLDFQGGGRKLG